MTKASILALSISGVALFAAPSPVFSKNDLPQPPPEASAAQVVFLGEQHDNPAHHKLQAAWVDALDPRALVFEMLTAEQADLVTPENRANEETLESALGWEDAGWPDFAMYFPIFEAASDAQIVGAGLPRGEVQAMMDKDIATVLDPAVSARFGLDQALPSDQQAAREALQREAHCNALPESLLPKMVDVQRLRDAALARAALDAFERFGAPVVVITGNGHARDDWGAPHILRQANADLSVFSLGQGEAGQGPQGGFDVVVDGPAVDRGNPCDAFN